MSGIILAVANRLAIASDHYGGEQLLPVFDIPMVYYPLSTLILAGIRRYLGHHHPGGCRRLAGCWGMVLSSVSLSAMQFQPSPDGLAQAFVIGRTHIGTDRAALVLGDNIFYGPGLGARLSRFSEIRGGGIFVYRASDPTAYGVVEFDDDGGAISLEEKPKRPPLIVASMRSPTSTARIWIGAFCRSRFYLAAQPGLTPGPFDPLLDAGNYVRTIEQRQGLKIGAPEEVAWRRGFISDDELRERAERLIKSGYGGYLLGLLDEVA
jgi:glucose-1-phosphate thymidylyltransferase